MSKQSTITDATGHQVAIHSDGRMFTQTASPEYLDYTGPTLAVVDGTLEAWHPTSKAAPRPDGLLPSGLDWQIIVLPSGTEYEIVGGDVEATDWQWRKLAAKKGARLNSIGHELTEDEGWRRPNRRENDPARPRAELARRVEVEHRNRGHHDGERGHVYGSDAVTTGPTPRRVTLPEIALPDPIVGPVRAPDQPRPVELPDLYLPAGSAPDLAADLERDHRLVWTPTAEAAAIRGLRLRDQSGDDGWALPKRGTTRVSLTGMVSNPTRVFTGEAAHAAAIERIEPDHEADGLRRALALAERLERIAQPIPIESVLYSAPKRSGLDVVTRWLRSGRERRSPAPPDVARWAMREIASAAVLGWILADGRLPDDPAAQRFVLYELVGALGHALRVSLETGAPLPSWVEGAEIALGLIDGRRFSSPSETLRDSAR